MLNVTFTPTVNGTVRGGVTIGYNFGVGPQVLSVTGTGVGGVAGALSFSKNTLGMGNIVVGTTGATQTVSVKNSSKTAVNITSVVVSGGYNNVTVSGECGGTLAAAAQCNVGVSFSPKYPGTIYGSVTLSDDAGVSPQMISLTGVGILPVTLTPATLTFALQAVGTKSATQTVTLTNNQSTTVTLTGVVASGDYTVMTAGTNPCGSSVAANGQCNLGVAFSPTVAGTIAGALTVSHSAGTSPQEVTLSGTAQ
jgi:Abnormal spindle-like microcephaly-assoc'd, ASPM-SPD-2-Hydin